MAERRMFSKTIIDSDIFLDMPTSSRLLYYDLAMRADDDGFINNPRKIARMTGASDDDLKILASKNYIIPFDSGIVVIRHWRVHNYIRKDTYNETQYKLEKSTLELDNNKCYSIISDDRPRAVDEPSTQVRLGKDRLDKDSIAQSNAPAREDVRSFCEENGYTFSADEFFDTYQASHWCIKGEPIYDWKALAAAWERKEQKNRTNAKRMDYGSGNFEQKVFRMEDLDNIIEVQEE